MFQNFFILFGLLAIVAAKGFEGDTTDLNLQALIENLQEDRESGLQHSIAHGKAKDDRGQMDMKTFNLLFKNNKRQKHEADYNSENNAIDRLMCDITGDGGCGQDDSLDRSDDSRSDEVKFEEATFAQNYNRDEDDLNYYDDALVNEAKNDLQSLINDLDVQISGTKRKESSNTDVLQCHGSRCDLTFDSNDNDLKGYLGCKRKCSGTSEHGGNHKDELLCRRNCYAASGVEGVDLRCEKKCSGRSGTEGDQKSYLRCRRMCAARSRSDRNNEDEYERAGQGKGNMRCSGSRCGIQFDDRDNDMMDYLRCRRMCIALGETDHINDLRCRNGCYGRSGALRDDPSSDLRCSQKCQNARSGDKEQYLRCRRDCAIARNNPVYITVDEQHRARTFRIPTDFNDNVIDCKKACFAGGEGGRIQKDFLHCTHLCMMGNTDIGDKTRGLRCRGNRCGRSRTNSRDAEIDNNLKDVLDKYGKRYRLNNDLDAIVLDVDNIGDLLESLEITVDDGSFQDDTRIDKKSSNRPKYRLSSELIPSVPSHKKIKTIGDNIMLDRKQSKPLALDVNQKKLSLPEFLEGVSNIRDIPLDILLNYIVDPKKNSWKAHIEQRGLSVSPEDADYLQYLRDNFQKFTDTEKAYLPILENVLQNSIALSSLKVLPGKSLEKKREVAYIQKTPAIAANVDTIKDKVPVYLWDQILSRTKLRSLLPLTQQQKLKMRQVMIDSEAMAHVPFTLEVEGLGQANA